MTPRTLHVVVVAYHASEMLDSCLRGLGDRFPVSVIDNSADEMVRAVAVRNGADYTDSGGNLGFGAGVNIALRNLLHGQPTDVLLLNPDAVISEANIRLLAARLHAPGNDKVAAVAPTIVDGDGQVQRVMWPFPSPARAALEAAGLGRLNRAPDYVIGAVLLLRWEAVREVGLFDERFFLYAEEADWQRRAARSGWVSRVEEGASAEHIGAGTSDVAERREALFHAGMETYIRKWFGGAGWLLFRTAVTMGALVRALVLRGSRRRQAAGRALLYLRGPRRVAGLNL